MTKILIAGLILFAGTSAVGTRASSVGTHRAQSQEVGSVSGIIRVSGAVGAPQVLSVGVDREVCTEEPLLDESLLVDSKSLGVKNVVVRITSIEEGTARPRQSDYPLALQQRNCRFEPHVLIVAAGREFSILNLDGILHNTHTRSRLNRPFNKAQPGFLKRVPATLKLPETIEVGCDAHNWMTAWIVVAEHRFYTLSGDLGEFRLDGVPAGRHELEIWHETLGTQTVQITVEAQKNAHVELEYRLPAG